MAKYKVLEAFELEGVAQEVGAEVELTEEQAAELAGKVEAVSEDGTGTPPAADAPPSDTPPANPPADNPPGEGAPSGENGEGKPGWAGGHPPVGAN